MTFVQKELIPFDYPKVLTDQFASVVISICTDYLTIEIMWQTKLSKVSKK